METEGILHLVGGGLGGVEDLGEGGREADLGACSRDFGNGRLQFVRDHGGKLADVGPDFFEERTDDPLLFIEEGVEQVQREELLVAFVLLRRWAFWTASWALTVSFSKTECHGKNLLSADWLPCPGSDVLALVKTKPPDAGAFQGVRFDCPTDRGGRSQ